jgi:cytochrome P450
MRQLRERYGDAFAVNVPIFGRGVVISDPAEIKQLFQMRADEVENVEPNLGRILGPGSIFALTGQEHRAQRKLLSRRSTAAGWRPTNGSSRRRRRGSWPPGQRRAPSPRCRR